MADNWLNLKRVKLLVFSDNPSAFHLYEKFDFVTEGTKRFHPYGDGRWATVASWHASEHNLW
ncbi:MAG: hypothetical protein ACE5E7_00400 [Anaerolineae bacterium]